MNLTTSARIAKPHYSDLVRSAIHYDVSRSHQCSDALNAGQMPLPQSAGSRFTLAVQHSWRGKRNVNAGLLALSILGDTVRRDLLDAWLKADKKKSSIIAVEADALLDFIADQLPDPSHELAVCRFEQLMLRANYRARTFTAPDYISGNSRRVLRRSLDAGIVLFRGDADVILGTLMQRLSLPSFSVDETALLIAPGLQPVCRIATLQEKELWNWLAVPTAWTILEHKGFSREMIEAMLRIGALD